MVPRRGPARGPPAAPARCARGLGVVAGAGDGARRVHAVGQLGEREVPARRVVGGAPAGLRHERGRRRHAARHDEQVALDASLVAAVEPAEHGGAHVRAPFGLEHGAALAQVGDGDDRDARALQRARRLQPAIRGGGDHRARARRRGRRARSVAARRRRASRRAGRCRRTRAAARRRPWRRRAAARGPGAASRPARSGRGRRSSPAPRRREDLDAGAAGLLGQLARALVAALRLARARPARAPRRRARRRRPPRRRRSPRAARPARRRRRARRRGGGGTRCATRARPGSARSRPRPAAWRSAFSYSGHSRRGRMKVL